MTVRFIGDGTPTDCRASYAPFPLRDNQLSGPVEEDTRVLLLVSKSMEAMADGVEVRMVPAVSVAGAWLGNWTIRDGMAVNVDPERTVPLDPLATRLIEEHEAGRQPEDCSGSRNPQEEQSTSTSGAQPSPAAVQGGY